MARLLILLTLTIFNFSYGCPECDGNCEDAQLESYFSRMEQVMNFRQTGNDESADLIVAELMKEGFIPKFEMDEEGNFHAENLHPIYRSDNMRNDFRENLVKFNICENEKDAFFSFQDSLNVKISYQDSPSCRRKNSDEDDSKEEECKERCNSSATLACSLCGTLPTRKCILLCAGMVETLRSGCHWCCGGGGFYNRCVRPLDRFVAPTCDHRDD